MHAERWQVDVPGAHHCSKLAAALHRERALPCARRQAAHPLRPHRVAKTGSAAGALHLQGVELYLEEACPADMH